jgi:hypothetical protein
VSTTIGLDGIEKAHRPHLKGGSVSTTIDLDGIEKAHRPHLKGGSVSTTIDLDGMEKRKSKHDSSVVQPIAYSLYRLSYRGSFVILRRGVSKEITDGHKT